MSDEHLDIIDTPDGLIADVQSMKDNEPTMKRRLLLHCRDNW